MSTGKIAKGLHRDFLQKGHNSYLCFGRGVPTSEYEYLIDKPLEFKMHALKTRLFGYEGTYSKSATRRLLAHFDEWKIDTIVALNLHAYYINRPMLFDYIKNHNVRFVNLMVDESSYLGKCCVKNDCTKYLTGCHDCPQFKIYPKSWFFDRAAELFEIKKSYYGCLKNKPSVFVGPEFVVSNAKEAPLTKGNRFEILDESIDVEMYSPQDSSQLKKKLGIKEEQKVVFCVAALNAPHKGGDYFLELAKRFEGNPEYEFVIVSRNLQGITKSSPNCTIVGYLERLEDMAVYYSMGDIFVCPSLCDTQPNACIEAMACGTPLLCFNISGMPYLADDRILQLVEPRNVDQMEEVIKRTGKKSSELAAYCRKYALERYDSREYSNKMLKIINSL